MASETIYDHPRYYDILFGFDRSKEAEFHHRILLRCGVAPVSGCSKWPPGRRGSRGCSRGAAGR